jgi:hypothetical protein
MKWTIPASCLGDAAGPPAIVAVLAAELAGCRLQQFPGAYLSADVRVVRGGDVPFTMIMEGLRS